MRWRPRVVLIEKLEAHRWEPVLMRHGYHIAITTEINRYYVREEDRSLISHFREPLGPRDSFVLAAEIQDHGVQWGESLPPNAMRTTLRLHELAIRHPRLAAVGKSLARLGG